MKKTTYLVYVYLSDQEQDLKGYDTLEKARAAYNEILNNELNYNPHVRLFRAEDISEEV
jgi:hypothetical protein